MVPIKKLEVRHEKRTDEKALRARRGWKTLALDLTCQVDKKGGKE